MLHAIVGLYFSCDLIEGLAIIESLVDSGMVDHLSILDRSDSVADEFRF